MKEVSEFSKWLIYQDSMKKIVKQTAIYKDWQGQDLTDRWYDDPRFARYLQNRFQLYWN